MKTPQSAVHFRKCNFSGIPPAAAVDILYGGCSYPANDSRADRYFKRASLFLRDCGKWPGGKRSKRISVGLYFKAEHLFLFPFWHRFPRETLLRRV